MRVAKNRQTIKYIVGVDEVGRGPLAGPVTVCAVCIPRRSVRHFSGIKDSKQLSHEQRVLWRNKARSLGIAWKVSSSSNTTIDTHGVTRAVSRAVARAVRGLNVDPDECHVLLDGGLRAPVEYARQTTIVHGDALDPTIALASVIAKISRDAHMVRLAKRYPQYGFDVHKGYGTKNTTRHFVNTVRLACTDDCSFESILRLYKTSRVVH